MVWDGILEEGCSKRDALSPQVLVAMKVFSSQGPEAVGRDVTVEEVGEMGRVQVFLELCSW